MTVKVFFTVDVEVWCGGWQDLDAKFPDAFERYVYGPTTQGRYGLPRTLERLSHHGLKGVFFTEPLFSCRFGLGPLAEIVGLVTEAGQEVQLHLHTEWSDEVNPPLVAGLQGKRQHLWMFDRAEQATLIQLGADLLRAAGAPALDAFRAGSFGLSADTWRVLAQLGIPFDSSFNGSMSAARPDLKVFGSMHQPRLVEGVWSYPMSLFRDGRGHLRHVQLGACSFRELEWLLWRAAEEEWESVVILSHNFELMNQAKTAPDPIVDRRFERLCRFLAANRDAFETVGFRNLAPPAAMRDVDVPRSNLPRTVHRVVEQAVRRIYG